MAEQLVSDELWRAIEPLLPAKRPPLRGGRPWIDERAVLGGIIYLLRTGVPGDCCRPGSSAAAVR